jgi:hypothetical protein
MLHSCLICLYIALLGEYSAIHNSDTIAGSRTHSIKLNSLYDNCSGYTFCMHCQCMRVFLNFNSNTLMSLELVMNTLHCTNNAQHQRFICHAIAYFLTVWYCRITISTTHRSTTTTEGYVAVMRT